jgi:hypothetical protein
MFGIKITGFASIFGRRRRFHQGVTDVSTVSVDFDELTGLATAQGVGDHPIDSLVKLMN